MGLTNEFARVQLGQITVKRDDRQRKQVDVGGLKESIQARGVLQPIIVSRQLEIGAEGPLYVLVAGERRLEASRQLNLPDIPVRFIEDLDQIEAQIIELEENIKRADLPWQDLVSAVARIHGLHQSQDIEWTQTETAQSIGLSPGLVSMYLAVSRQLDDDRIGSAGTVREAYNIIARRDQRAASDALNELYEATGEAFETQGTEGGPAGTPEGTPEAPGSSAPRPAASSRPSRMAPVQESILHESFVHWAPKYSGRRFNFIHCDFPYGIGVFDGEQGGGAGDSTSYDDSSGTYFRLLETLCKNLDGLMAVSGHLMFWYSAKHLAATMEVFAREAPTLKFWTHPLIWVKSDGKGIAQDYRRGPRHVYETCLFASRGDRQLIKTLDDVYSCPTDKRLHISTKPEPMLKHFFSMFVDETTEMLDPTSGSGSALRAAEILGARRVLGMDTNEEVVGLSRTALRQARTLASASRIL